MAANIDAEIRDIQQASRGEEVRDAIVNALLAINDSDSSATREFVTQIVNTELAKLDTPSSGGDGKYIKSISETDGKITAVEETMDTQPVQNSNKAITSGGVFSLSQTLQTNFQAGVDSIYDAVVAKGSTPASKSLSDVVQGIEDIPTGGESIIKHTDDWVKYYNIGQVQIDSIYFLWTDGTNLYYSNNYVDLIFDPVNLRFKPIEINVDIYNTKANGYQIFNFNGNTYLYDIDYAMRYIFDKESRTFKLEILTYNTQSSDTASRFWTDGENIYYSSGTNHFKYDKVSGIWSTKTWSGLTNFDGRYIWTDGTDIYYSNGSNQQYVLDKVTSTWNVKTWSGYNNFNGIGIWTDGDNIYYSSGNTQYELDKETEVWFNKTWNGLTSFNGEIIWTDGDNIYFSSSSVQYELDKETSTWVTKSWSGLTSFYGYNVWTDGENIYYSSDRIQYVLDKSTSTWSVKTWTNLTNFNGLGIWSDGDNVYWKAYILNKSSHDWENRYLKISSYNIWTDGTDIYYSDGSNQQYVLNKDLLTWNSKTWNGLTSFNGYNIWTDGTDIYYSNGSNQQYVLDKTTSTWNRKSWSGLTSIDGRNVRNINGNIYYTQSINIAYLLDKQNSAWNIVSNWNPINFNTVYEFNGVFYGFIYVNSSSAYKFTHYKYNQNNNLWSKVSILGPFALDSQYIWKCDDNIYLSISDIQLVFNKETKIWSEKQWSGITNINGNNIWTDGENYYYSNSGTQYILNKERSLWYTKTWNGLTSFSKSQLWDDGENIYYSNGQTAYKLENPEPEPTPTPESTIFVYAYSSMPQGSYMQFYINPDDLSRDGCSEVLTKSISDLQVGDTIAFTGPGWIADSLPPAGGFTLADIETWGCFTETAVVKDFNNTAKYVGNLHLANPSSSDFPDTGETYVIIFNSDSDFVLMTDPSEDYFNELFIAKIVTT